MATKVPKLLFIISQPRSGSTLLQSIVSNNQYVATTSEPWLLLPFLGLYEPTIANARYNYQWMTKAVLDFARKHGGDELFKRKLRDFLLAVYSNLIEDGTVYILDKTPRYYEIVQLIFEFFPDARFIILKRNPFAVANSILTTWNTNTLQKLTLYEQDLLSAPFRIQEFLKVAGGSENVLEMHYEKMVTDPYNTFGKIYDWLSIPFEERVLYYSDNTKFKGVYGDQVGIKKYDMPQAENIDSWKALLRQPFWGNWLKGYSGYLGARILKEFGNYELLFDEPTEEFRYFRFICSKNGEEKYRVTREMRKLIRYGYYRAKFGVPTKERALKQN